MHSPASLLPRPTRTPLVVLRPTPPVVVAWSPGDRAAIIRAAAREIVRTVAGRLVD